MAPTATSVVLEVPTKDSNPNATKIFIEIIAAGPLAYTPQGGEGSCNYRVYKEFAWN